MEVLGTGFAFSKLDRAESNAFLLTLKDLGLAIDTRSSCEL